MCNYSELVEERGVKKGIEQGIEQGRSGQLSELVAANLRAGRRPEEFADFLGLTVEQVEEIAKGLPTVA